MWLYGSGFPKSHDISKAIDKEAGAEREVVGVKRGVRGADGTGHESAMPGKATGVRQVGIDVPVTAPATDAARQWNGWGTALKPAYEPITLAMKPLDGTYAQNTLRWGCGGINVDGCRIGLDDTRRKNSPEITGDITRWRTGKNDALTGSACGRWPANVILDEQSAEMLDQQSGESVSSGGTKPVGGNYKLAENRTQQPYFNFGDAGGASRFFYCAKASRSERNAGLEGMPRQFSATMGSGIGKREHDPAEPRAYVQNRHPTVKPLALMRWLVRLVTPPGGTVLDPFAGSGSTGIAAKQEGFGYILIDNDPENCAIAKRRVEHWLC
jgi:site-specific DNA-methyltransferase (adenine-specific)